MTLVMAKFRIIAVFNRKGLYELLANEPYSGLLSDEFVEAVGENKMENFYLTLQDNCDLIQKKPQYLITQWFICTRWTSRDMRELD